MVVDRDRQHALGGVLADHIIVEVLADFERRRHRAVLARSDPALDFLADDVVAQFDAFIADEYGGAGNQLADFMLRLAAEGAVKSALAVRAAQFRHKSSSGSRKRALPSFILARDHPITIWQLGDIGTCPT